MWQNMFLHIIYQPREKEFLVKCESGNFVRTAGCQFTVFRVRLIGGRGNE